MKSKITILSIFLAISFHFDAQLTNYSVGDVAPDFTVTDLHGKTHKLSDYAGKWILIDFFAYWCGPCAAIAPTINSFYKKYGCNGYDIVVLSLEGDGTTAQTQSFEDQNGGDPNFPTPTVSGLDGGANAVHTIYGPSAYPTIIIVGSDGLIKNTDLWPISSVSSIETAFNNAGASAALVAHNCDLLGVEENTAISLEPIISPNPNNGNFKLEFNLANHGNLNIEVYSLLGEKLTSISYPNIAEGKNNIDLDLTSLQSGHYFLTLKNTNEISAPLQIQIVK